LLTLSLAEADIVDVLDAWLAEQAEIEGEEIR
jgi:hypothetical protein